MKKMTLEDLEDAICDILPDGFEITEDDNGQVVINTGLSQNDEGNLVSIFSDNEDDDDDDEDNDYEEYDDDKSYEND